MFLDTNVTDLLKKNWGHRTHFWKKIVVMETRLLSEFFLFSYYVLQL